MYEKVRTLINSYIRVDDNAMLKHLIYMLMH